MAPSPSPPSYEALPFTQIKLTHHPPSPIPTSIIILTLHRPQYHNAFTEHMRREIVDAYALFEADPRIRAIVMTGHGPRFFCAGADLNIGFEKEEGGPKMARDGGGCITLAIHNCSKPTIGALNGSAVGVGITMTLPMAIRVASLGARFGFVFARRGIVTDAVASFFLPRLIGYSRALHLVTTGGVYAATDPLFRDLFTELVEQERVLPRALEIAEEVVTNTSLVSGKLIRDLVWRGRGSAEATHLLESELLAEMFGSRDNQEGVNSFLEKRPPKFSGTMEGDAPKAWPWWDPIDTSSPINKEISLKTIKSKI